jgi:hypothetical protein
MRPTRRGFLAATGGAAIACAQPAGMHLKSAALREGIDAACAWIANVAQMKSDTLAGESNSHNLQHRHWKGALRGEYSAATRQWDFFCPIWHTGQAIKSLVLAARALERPALLDAARFSADFIGAERVSDPAHAHYGLIFGYEDRGDQVNTSAILECVDGLWLLADATGEARYAEWARAAVDWVARNAYMGEGLCRDAFEVRSWRYVAPPWKTDKPGRPLIDDAVFLKGGHKKVFHEIAARLLREEDPPGNWIGFVPCNPVIGVLHPRQAFWWGDPLIAAYRDSGDKRYLECARRSGEWYRGAMRSDGGLFRATTRDFKTPSFGHETSGIACAAILWLDLWKETRDDRWLEAIARALHYCLNMQFREVRDPNLKGAVLEQVKAPNGSDASPYRLRDLGTIFFAHAASRVLIEKVSL